MRIPAFTTLLAMCLIGSGCAITHDPGWQGQNASPFATAEAACNEEAAQNPGAQELTFRNCMTRHGWTRGGRG